MNEPGINYIDEDYKYYWVNALLPFIFLVIALVRCILNGYLTNIRLSFLIFLCIFFAPFIFFTIKGITGYLKRKKKRLHNLNIIKNGTHFIGTCKIIKHTLSGVSGRSSTYWDASVVYLDKNNKEHNFEISRLAGYNFKKEKSECDIYILNDEIYVDIVSRNIQF